MNTLGKKNIMIDIASNFSKVLKFSSLIILILLISVGSCFATNDLEKEDFLIKELKSGETHVYVIHSGSNQFLDLVVNQISVDVFVKLYSPNGNCVYEVDSPNGDNGTEPVYCVLDDAGDYKLEISVFDEGELVFGQYSIKFNDIRNAKEEDRKFSLAEKMFRELVYSFQIHEASRHSMPLTQTALEAAAIYKEIGLRAKELQCFFFAGTFAYNLLEHELALSIYNRALNLAVELGDTQNQVRSLSTIGLLYFDFANFTEARRFNEKALSLIENYSTKDENYILVIATTLLNTGLCYEALGENKTANLYLQMALDKYNHLGYLQGQSVSLQIAGKIYSSLGEIDKSLECFYQSLSLAQKADNLKEQIASLSHIAKVHIKFNPQKSIELLFRAIELNNKINDLRYKGIILNLLGSTYHELGNYEKAKDYYNQALSIFQSKNLHLYLVQIYGNLANIHFQKEEYKKSLEYCHKGLLFVNRFSFPVEEVKFLNTVGNINLKLKEFQVAEDNFNKAFEKAVQINNKNLQLEIKYNQIYKDFLLGKNDEVRKFCYENISLAESLKNNKITVLSLFLLASINDKEKKYDEATTNLNKLLSLIETDFYALKSDDLRVSFLSSIYDFYSFGIELYLKRYIATKDNTYAMQALELSEKSHARALIELLNEKDFGNYESSNENFIKLVREKNELKTAFNHKSEYYAKILNTDYDEDSKRRVKIELDEISKKLALASSSLLELHPKYGKSISTKFSYKDIQKEVVNDKNVLVEYFLGASNSCAWVITPSSINTYILANNQQIEPIAVNLFNAVQNNGSYVELSRKLSSFLILPFYHEIKGKNIIIVPDKTLSFVPFALLPNPDKSNKSPLVLNHQITYLSSALTSLQLNSKSKENYDYLVSDSALLLGDPVFNKNDLRISNNKLDNSQIGTDASRGMLFPRLLGSREEVEKIKGLFFKSKLNAKLLLDFDSSVKSLINSKLNFYKYIHFSTHNYLNNEYAGASGLVLSLVDPKGDSQDGFLTVNNIANMEINAELVVLSSCKSISGKQQNGEGVVGLTRAFFCAGAKRVIGSLWNVNDYAGSELMVRFYKYLLEDQMPPSMALQQAQISMLNDKEWSNPFFWAGFKLEGK
jgi:CHAT domain-containing protein